MMNPQVPDGPPPVADPSLPSGEGRIVRVARPLREEDGRYLPLERQLEAAPNGFFIRLPVRREEVSVEKRTVVVEEVDIRKRREDEIVRSEETIRKEELIVEAGGELEIDRLGDTPPRR